MAKIISMERDTTEGGKETVYPRTYALAVFLNDGQTSILDAIGDGWNTTGYKTLKVCSEKIDTLNSTVENLQSQIDTLNSTVKNLQSQITSLTSRISTLEKSNS